MTYQPRFSDPRVRQRVQQATEFVESHLREGQSRQISRQLLTQQFGNGSRDLGAWLREYLLETTDSHWNLATGKCKSYRRRPGAVAQLRALASISATRTIAPQIQNQIDTGDFKYQLRSDRWYNPVQFMPSQQRQHTLAQAGYHYVYDIKAAAPTVLLQRAQQLDPDWSAPDLEAYIQDRSRVRELIADQAGVTTAQVKLIITAILQGSVLTTWSSSRLFQELGSDAARIDRLRHSAALTGIRHDIRGMWRVLRSQFTRCNCVDSRGRTRLRRVTARDKSGYYRQLERQIARVIRRSLRQQHARFLWVHDGWHCNQIIDADQLCARVRQQTGFRIQLDCTVVEQQGSYL
jgi:hypothetical protein